MFLHVKLDRTSTTKKFVATNGEETKDLGKKTVPLQSVEGVHNIHERKRCDAVFFISPRKVVQVGNVAVLEEDPYSRNNRDGTAVKLDVSTEVFTLVMWCVSMRIWLLECQKQNW